MRTAHFVMAAVMCHAAAALGAQDTFTVPLMRSAPKIDGRVETQEWAVAAGFDGFQFEGRLVQRRVHAYVGATEDAIHIAVKTQLPDEGELAAKVDLDSLKAVFDDSLEIYIDPNPGEQRRVVYQFLVNSKGKGGYKVHIFGGADEDVSWSGDWPQVHALRDGWWHFECSIPVASMKAARGRTTTEGQWAVNLARNWKSPWEWSSLSGGYVDALPSFRFVRDGAPSVRYEVGSDPFLANFTGTLTIHNPSRRRLPVRASMILDRNRMPALRAEEDLTIPPGGSEKVVLQVPQDDPTTKYDLNTTVTSADGGAIYYARKTVWPKSGAYHWVAGQKKDVVPVDFRFSYYPYKNRMRIVADVSGLSKDAQLRRVIAEVRKAGTKQPVKTVEFPSSELSDGRKEKSFELPPLEGEYEIALRAEGTNVPNGEVVKAFERKRWEWEGTTLGTSTEVYPPFTPIVTKRSKLMTVLREHDLNGFGLWDQVTCTSAHTGIAKPVLAAPMRYTAKIDGADVELKPSRMRFKSRAPHEAQTLGGFGSRELSAISRSTWEYDGTVRVELDLTPSGGRTVDELTLEIPFLAEAATLLHANADRIRAPVAMRIGEADGVVWDATKLACDDYIKNFCPYIFIGTPVRGICWFAENDLGWGWDPKTPNLEVVRTGDEVVLRVHLINTPTVIEKQRRITFGMLAAPVKPRLSPGGKNWWRYRYLRDKYTLLGTDINWLSMGTCGSVYPAGRDMYFWEMISRGNRGVLGDDVIAEVTERGKKYFEPYGQDKVNSWAAHVGHNLRSRRGANMVFYYNRASHQGAEEFQTFEDEWALNDLRSVGKGNGLGEIKIVPTKSYIDHALYWYAKSFEIGNNKGVYWDNWFIAPSFNTEMTDAYRREDGSIVPAAGIWGHRDLCKRTFIMMNELGRLPITFPHMTSFNPLPMMSFGTVQYDWEWKYSMGDVQDRHSRELILTTGTGELSGVWPVPLAEHGKLQNDDWTQRTFAAVRLVHELDGQGGFGQGWQPSHQKTQKLFDPILQLLDEPELKVYRYWDDVPQPVVATDPDLPTIVYGVPGKVAVAVVVSYADEDRRATLRLDAEALGFRRPPAVTDVETGKTVSVGDGEIKFLLKKHDIRVLRLTDGE